MAEGHAHKIGRSTYVALRVPARWPVSAELAATAEWVVVATWPDAPVGGVPVGWLTRGRRGGLNCYLGSGLGIQLRRIGSAPEVAPAVRLVAEAHQRRRAKKAARRVRQGELTRQQAKRAKWPTILAVCTGCKPELNVPFADPADRDRWADEHTAETGHLVSRPRGRQLMRRAATTGPDRAVTPETDPDRWTPQEAALFRAGRCSYQVSDGGWGSGPPYCGDPSKPGASFGHCARHDAEMLVDHFADGTDRYRADPYYQSRPDYQARVDTALAAHQAWCRDPRCECRW